MEYFGIEKEYNSKITVKRSQFIGTLVPVYNKEEAEKEIKRISGIYHDAKHNCYAYIVGDYSKYSDDGEPGGTAGEPILNLLKHENMNNCLLVVTRYFGGVLLGTGGLLRAYSDCASLAISASEKNQFIEYSIISGNFDYSHNNLINSLISRFNCKIVSSNYVENVSLEIAVTINETENFINQIKELTNGAVIFDKIGEKFLKV